MLVTDGRVEQRTGLLKPRTAYELVERIISFQQRFSLSRLCKPQKQLKIDDGTTSRGKWCPDDDVACNSKFRDKKCATFQDFRRSVFMTVEVHGKKEKRAILTSRTLENWKKKEKQKRSNKPTQPFLHFSAASCQTKQKKNKLFVIFCFLEETRILWRENYRHI